MLCEILIIMIIIPNNVINNFYNIEKLNTINTNKDATC